MTITQSTYTSALILFLVTAIVIYGILKLTTPSVVLSCDKKFSTQKTLVLSVIISAIFTIFISYISIRIEQHNLFNDSNHLS